MKESRAATTNEVEQAALLLEKAATPQVNQRESIEVHLLVVGFDLREIGVHREVERKAARERVPYVESDFISGAAFGPKAWRCRKHGLAAGCQRVRCHVQRRAGSHVAHNDVARDRRPAELELRVDLRERHPFAGARTEADRK